MSRWLLCFACWLSCALGALLPQVSRAASTLVFSTAFEQAEGYIPNMVLGGQRGWLVEGTGGNRITQTMNQQVSLGYNAPASDSEQSTTLWKPLNVGTIPSNALVKFSVDIAVLNSMTINHDQFRWSVYNTNNQPLLSLVFDNASLRVSYILSDGISHDAGTNFVNGAFFGVILLMDFTGNRWNAWVNGNDLQINAPIRLDSESLSLADVRAVWRYFDPSSAGDNYMLFDNYRVTIETLVPAMLEAISSTNSQFRLRVFGENGSKYTVEGNSTLASNGWIALGTSTVTSNSFDFVDPIGSRRFYRARWTP